VNGTIPGCSIGKKVKEGIMIDLGRTRQDLSEISGTGLYTASRTLSQWQGQDLIIAGREKVIIRNPHGLVRIIEGSRDNTQPPISNKTSISALIEIVRIIISPAVMVKNAVNCG
jgi:hypothetical protein